MPIQNATVILHADVQRVWDTVTSLEDYAWRSDLDSISVLNDTQFQERTKEGFVTTFTVTAKKPCERWEFDIDNENMYGHWTGIFTQKGRDTELQLTEDVTAKRLVMKPFVKGYLKKQQSQYLTDLREALALKANT